jgi:3-oxoacyl-ACP reductase-like protein
MRSYQLSLGDWHQKTFKETDRDGSGCPGFLRQEPKYEPEQSQNLTRRLSSCLTKRSQDPICDSGFLRPLPSSIASAQVPISKRKCYVCHFLLVSSHGRYSSLYKPCGEFNLASCALSLPQNLHLEGKTALVTGGRLDLGYHTALRLLRCGAKVIVSTRYPRDAKVRYLAEHVSRTSGEQLKIIGADFRAASDVFHLVEVVRECSRHWDEQGEGKLDILVSNTAQTLTDSLEKEHQAVQQEKRLHGSRP